MLKANATPASARIGSLNLSVRLRVAGAERFGIEAVCSPVRPSAL